LGIIKVISKKSSYTNTTPNFCMKAITNGIR